MVPDIVEIKRLCSSGQWLARIENGKVLLHDTVSGETVCVGQTDAEPVRHGRWVWADDGYLRCGECTQKAPTTTQYQDEPIQTATSYCPNCGARMDAEVEG